MQKFKKVKGAKSDQLDTQFMPVPYNLSIQLYVMAKQSDDALQIVEQILPYFQPDYTLTVNDMADMGIKRDITIILNSIGYEDNYQGDFETRRALIHTLNFTLKGYLWGPIRKSGIIKTANVMTHVDTSAIYANSHPANTVIANVNVTDTSSSGYYLHSRTTTTPGLLANGSPTSNASLSVGIANIDEDDDYGYIHNFEEWFSANTSA